MMASVNILLSVGAWIAAVFIGCCCIDFFADTPKPSKVCLETEGVASTDIPTTNYYRGQVDDLVKARAKACRQNNEGSDRKRYREKNCPEKNFYGLACRTAFKVVKAMDACKNDAITYLQAEKCAQLGQCTWEAYEYDEPKAALKVIEKITDCCKKLVTAAEEKKLAAAAEEKAKS